MPLHPLFPGFAVASSIYFSTLLLFDYWRWLLPWPALGLVFYFANARRSGRIVRHGRQTFGENTDLPAKSRYRVLVAAGDGRRVPG